MEKNKPAIEVIGEEQCTGCFGCYNSCPVHAVEMKHNKEGFFIPFINDKCENCGICQEHCPVIQNLPDEKKFGKPKFYGARSTDKKTRMMSSSGGIFPEIARYVLENSGIVFGAGWDEDFELIHTRINDIDEIKKLTGSKYIQSNIGNAYKEVKNEIENGKKVLFVGTPCQVAALNTHIEHQHLLTVDLVCHGVPSRLLFKKYLEYRKEEHEAEIDLVSFRDKKKGWKDFQMKIVFDDGSVYEKHHKLDPYFKAYLPNLCLRDSCYECEFNSIPRPGDITLGDFWGNPPEKIRTNEGVSLILANNNKARRILKELKDKDRIEIKKTDKNKASESNPRVDGGEFQVPDRRSDFLEDLKIKDFEILQDDYIIIPNPIEFRLKSYLFKIISKLRNNFK